MAFELFHKITRPAAAEPSGAVPDQPPAVITADPPVARAAPQSDTTRPDRTDAARRQAQQQRPAAPGPQLPPAAINPPKIPPDITERAAAMKADIAQHGGQLSDEVGLTAMLAAISMQLQASPGSITSPNVLFVDAGRDNREKRAYILDWQTGNVVRGPFLAAAGEGSGPRVGVPGKFTPGAKQTTELGLSITYKIGPITRSIDDRDVPAEALYQRGVGVLNTGVDSGAKYIHPADEYVKADNPGRSDGGPATSTDDYQAIRDSVGVGGATFIYSPQANWRLIYPKPNQDGGVYQNIDQPVRVTD